jgi:Domain of unknown function (DUF4136)
MALRALRITSNMPAPRHVVGNQGAGDMRKMSKAVPFPVYATLLGVKALMLVLLLAGCASAPDVRIDKAPAANLSGYKTFGFYDHLPSDRGATYSSIMTARLKQSTRDELVRHGYVYSEKNPDLKVNFNWRVTERQELRSYPTSNGVLIRRAGLQDYDLVHYRQGTVAIDLVDNHLKSLVWQGVANGRVDDKVMEDPGKAIDTVVRHIFVGFPSSRKD